MRFILATLVATLSLYVHASAQTKDVVLGKQATDAGLQLTEVARDLDFPMGMTPLPDGSLLVATSPSAAGDFYNSTGELVRLTDSDNDGTFDKRTALATDLPGSLVAVIRTGELVFTTSAQSGNEQIMIFRRGDKWRDPLVPVEAIHFAFNGALHQSYALAVRQNPDDSSAIDLFFNIGSHGNDERGPDVAFTGIINGHLAAASIYMVTITDKDGALTFSDPVQVAAGLRNGASLNLDPKTGDLWIGENGIDGFVSPIVAFSADELDRVPAEDIGITVHDFGFPDAYVESATGKVVGENTADFTFLPLKGSEAEGIAGFTFLPASFPDNIAGGIIAGFHGQFDLTGIPNEENPVRWVNPASGDQFDLISNDSPNVGHMDSMVTVGDVVYLADFCQSSIANSPGCGVIYRLSAS